MVIVFSLATTAYTLLTADPQELERLIYEQTGAFAGGSAAASLSTGACFVFGIATAGWGLLACGLVGGIVGGLVGSHAGSRIYYAHSPHFETLVNLSSIVDASSLASEPPLNMCVGP